MSDERVRASPPDDLEKRLSYYRGIVHVIEGTFDSDLWSAHRLSAFFGSPVDDGLYRAKFLAKARDRELSRAARAGGSRAVTWQSLRAIALRAAQLGTSIVPASAAALFASGALKGLGAADCAQFGGIFDDWDGEDDASRSGFALRADSDDGCAPHAGERAHTLLRLKGRSFRAVWRTAVAAHYTSQGRRFELLVNNFPMGLLLVTFGLPDLPQQVIPLVSAFCERLRVQLA